VPRTEAHQKEKGQQSHCFVGFALEAFFEKQQQNVANEDEDDEIVDLH
jgi:hypothetical protein